MRMRWSNLLNFCWLHGVELIDQVHFQIKSLQETIVVAEAATHCTLAEFKNREYMELRIEKVKNITNLIPRLVALAAAPLKVVFEINGGHSGRDNEYSVWHLRSAAFWDGRIKSMSMNKQDPR